MADQNDNKPDLVGLAAIHDANEDRAVDSLDWRDVLHDHLKEAAGKSYSFRAPRGEQIPFFAMKPSAFEPSKADLTRFLNEIGVLPGVIVFEDGEPTDAVPTMETAREHNERKYPDLMRRIDALANRPLKDDSDDR